MKNVDNFSGQHVFVALYRFSLHVVIDLPRLAALLLWLFSLEGGPSPFPFRKQTNTRLKEERKRNA